MTMQTMDETQTQSAPAADELVITDLHVAVEGKEILKGLNLTIRKGEVHAIMGPNGSGKSTLVNALMGCLLYTSDAADDLVGC